MAHVAYCGGMTEFSQRFKDARPRRISQAAAAEHIGVSDSTVSMWERGLCWPPTNDLARLLALYETPDFVRLQLLDAAAREGA